MEFINFVSYWLMCFNDELCLDEFNVEVVKDMVYVLGKKMVKDFLIIFGVYFLDE